MVLTCALSGKKTSNIYMNDQTINLFCCKFDNNDFTLDTKMIKVKGDFKKY